MNAVAIVTGAAGGIGGATVSRLLADGFAVCAVDRAPVDVASERTRLRIVEDLADPQPSERIVKAVLDRFGSIDVLINNAGIGGAHPVHETADDDWARILDINLTGAFRMSRVVLPGMLARRSGKIVHVASIFGLIGYRSTAAYAVSKAGLDGHTRQMTADYAARGVRVNAVAPGLIRTEMTERLLADAVYRELVLEDTPVGRTGEVGDVADLISFLVSDRTSFICGQTIAVDGGWTAATLPPMEAVGKRSVRRPFPSRRAGRCRRNWTRRG